MNNIINQIEIESKMAPYFTKVDTATHVPILVPKKKSLGIVYMSLSETIMEAMYQQLMDDGLVSEGHVSHWKSQHTEEEGDGDRPQSETIDNAVLTTDDP
jgi:PHD/YefM family antitoxin component YafN of YafNO toxin-antitoxin module